MSSIKGKIGTYTHGNRNEITLGLPLSELHTILLTTPEYQKLTQNLESLTSYASYPVGFLNMITFSAQHIGTKKYPWVGKIDESTLKFVREKPWVPDYELNESAIADIEHKLRHDCQRLGVTIPEETTLIECTSREDGLEEYTIHLPPEILDRLLKEDLSPATSKYRDGYGQGHNLLELNTPKLPPAKEGMLRLFPIAPAGEGHYTAGAAGCQLVEIPTVQLYYHSNPEADTHPSFHWDMKEITTTYSLGVTSYYEIINQILLDANMLPKSSKIYENSLDSRVLTSPSSPTENGVRVVEMDDDDRHFYAVMGTMTPEALTAYRSLEIPMNKFIEYAAKHKKNERQENYGFDTETEKTAPPDENFGFHTKTEQETPHSEETFQGFAPTVERMTPDELNKVSDYEIAILKHCHNLTWLEVHLAEIKESTLEAHHKNLGTTAFSSMLQKNAPECAQLLLDESRVTKKMLKQPIYDTVARPNYGGMTPLMLAAQKGYTTIVKSILDHPAIDSSDLSFENTGILGNHALGHAIKEGHIDVVQAFLESDKITEDLIAEALVKAISEKKSEITETLVSSEKLSQEKVDDILERCTSEALQRYDKGPTFSVLLASKKVTEKMANSIANQILTDRYNRLQPDLLEAVLTCGKVTQLSDYSIAHTIHDATRSGNNEKLTLLTGDKAGPFKERAQQLQQDYTKAKEGKNTHDFFDKVRAEEKAASTKVTHQHTHSTICKTNLNKSII